MLFELQLIVISLLTSKVFVVTFQPKEKFQKSSRQSVNPLSPKKKPKGDTLSTGGSVTGSNQLRKEVSKTVTTRRSSRLLTNPACNTRSKKMKDL